jgi:hypothetical protein
MDENGMEHKNSLIEGSSEKVSENSVESNNSVITMIFAIILTFLRCLKTFLY